MKILFVDHDIGRCAKFTALFDNCKAVCNSEAAIDALETGHYDIICIDGYYGYEIVDWILDKLPSMRRVYIHARNPKNALKLRKRLNSLGYIALCIPYPQLTTFTQL